MLPGQLQNAPFSALGQSVILLYIITYATINILNADIKNNMRSEHRFIPDTISGISTNSKYIQGVNNQSGTGYQSDSVDHLASEILKGRALRMKQQ